MVIPPIDNSLEGITVYGNQSPSPYLTSAPTILPPTMEDIAEAEKYKASQKDKMATALDVPVDYNEVQRKAGEEVQKNNVNSNNGAFTSPINPYGGWNMENTATVLGAFAQDKNALGVVGSAGKLLLLTIFIVTGKQIGRASCRERV